MAIARQASEITLPAKVEGCTTVLQFLLQRFPFIDEQIWRERISQQKVHWYQGAAITEHTRYAPGKRLCYYREVAMEPEIPLSHHIVFQDEHILIADKPHFLPVTPGGQYVNECLLARLKCQTGITDLVPVHRLDRETAGLVLFSINPTSRASYYQLFSEQQVDKQYQAVAAIKADLAQALPISWHVKNRIEKSTPRFINSIVPGEVNAVSDICLLAQKAGLGLFELTPVTGKTHQLRLHMLSLGMPILNDRYYPVLQPQQLPQFDKPLQLLAKHISFIDPVTNLLRQFSSQQQLDAW